jgi:ankyrin repeat protein
VTGIGTTPDFRTQSLIRSACSADVREARALLADDPALARRDLACACVTGELDAVLAVLERSPELARRTVPPLNHEPILYACFSRLPRVEPGRAAGIRAVVQSLLDAGADPNASFDHEGWLQVPLYGAAGILNDAELTRMLIEAGADPNDVRKGGPRAVGEALYHASEFEDPSCAQLLIEAGTDRHVVDFCLGRALNFPYEELVEMFCAHGARASAGNLHQAVWRRRSPGTVSALIDAGAPVDEPDQNGLTALQIATRWGEDQVAGLLQERGADPAAVRDQDRALGAYLSAGTRPSERPPPGGGLDAMLQAAVEGGHADTVRRLLEAGARVDGDPASEEVPLGHAAWRGYPEIVRDLVAAGAQLEFRDGGSAIGAALHGSRHCHHPEGGPTMRTIDEVPKAPYAEVVRILLGAGAQVPGRAIDGTPAATLMGELGLDPLG